MSGPRRQDGRLAPFVDGYRVRLLELGYTPQTVRLMLKNLGQLGRWMAAEDVAPRQLDRAGVEAFLAARRAGGERRSASMGELRQLIAHLRAVGAMPPEPPQTFTPVELLVDDYRQRLIRERGLAAMTVLRYETLARRVPDQPGLAGGRARRRRPERRRRREILGRGVRAAVGRRSEGKGRRAAVAAAVPARMGARAGRVGGVGPAGRWLAGDLDPAMDAPC